MSQAHITCLLDLTSDTNLPVLTSYINLNDTHFKAVNNVQGDSFLVAPDELVGTPGPNGDYATWRYVIIHRDSRKLVRSLWLGRKDQAVVCERPPLE